MIMNNIFDNDLTSNGNLLDDSLTQMQSLDPLENSYDRNLPDIQPTYLDTTMDNVLDQNINTTFDSAQPDHSLYNFSTPHHSSYNSVSLHSEVSISNTPLPVTIVKPPTYTNLNLSR